MKAFNAEFWDWVEGDWDYLGSYVEDTRSLADIKRIAELETYKNYYQELVEARGYYGITHLLVADTGHKLKIAELEKDKVKLKKIVDNHSGGFVACMTGSQFTANNLKQQAKALNEYAYSNKPLTKRGLNLESIALSDQAKTLKEQGK